MKKYLQNFEFTFQTGQIWGKLQQKNLKSLSFSLWTY